MRMSRAVKVVLAFSAAAVLLMPVAWTVADEATVVVSRPGTVFHKAGSDDVRGRGFEKSLSEALAAGYVPCHLCFGQAAPTLELSASLGAAGAASSASGGSGALGALAALKASTPEQPFGTKVGYPPFGFNPKGAIKDPYELNTLTHPGSEQGAYCSCHCKNYPPTS